MKRSWRKIQLRQSLQQKKNDTVFVLTPPQRREKGGTRGVMGRRKRWELPFSFFPLPLSPMHFNISLSPISTQYKRSLCGGEKFLSAWFYNFSWLRVQAVLEKTQSLPVSRCQGQHQLVSNLLWVCCFQLKLP